MVEKINCSECQDTGEVAIHDTDYVGDVRRERCECRVLLETQAIVNDVIPRIFRKKKWEDYGASKSIRDAVYYAPSSVWLWGRTGTGKSLLAALKLKQKIKLCVRQSKNPGEVTANVFFFLSVKEFFDRLLPASVRDEDDAPRFDFDWLTQSGYLVLDDIDKRKPTNERQDMLYALFNTLVEGDVPMAITSNKSPAKYVSFFFSDPEYREAVLDRIGSHFKIIETVGESFRIQGGKK